MFTGQGQSHLLHVSFSDMWILSGASSNDKSSLLLGYNFVYVANFLISLLLPSLFIAKYHMKLNEIFCVCELFLSLRLSYCSISSWSYNLLFGILQLITLEMTVIFIIHHLLEGWKKTVIK